jgi:hypothetical protein
MRVFSHILTVYFFLILLCTVHTPTKTIVTTILPCHSSTARCAPAFCLPPLLAWLDFNNCATIALRPNHVEHHRSRRIATTTTVKTSLYVSFFHQTPYHERTSFSTHLERLPRSSTPDRRAHAITLQDALCRRRQMVWLVAACRQHTAKHDMNAWKQFRQELIDV